MESVEDGEKSEWMNLPAGLTARTILTVDWEDWYHILEEDQLGRTAWEQLPTHVERDTLELLDLLERHGAQATFFVVGWLGKRRPHVLREIVRRGHRLGSHGYYHRCPNRMSKSEFCEDLMRSVALIQEVTGVRVVGYRAPGFAVRDCQFSYIDVLRGCGFFYDSSVFPGLFPGRGQMRAPKRPYHPDPLEPRFWEVPVSTVHMLGVPVVFSGGGALRLLPAWLVRLSARRAAGLGPVVYYLHPRDVCPESPMIRTCLWKRWRYYGGRGGLKQKLEDILRMGRVTSVEDFLADA